MKIDKKYIVIAVCILIGGVLTATLAFIGPDIITNGTINPNNVVTGNLKLKITDTSVNISKNIGIIKTNITKLCPLLFIFNIRYFPFYFYNIWIA